MSGFTNWLPAMARRNPERSIILGYQVPAGATPVDADRRIAEALHASSLKAVPAGDGLYRSTLPWTTRVFALIPRDVDEELELKLARRLDLWELVVSCRPTETHAAHAAGAAAVLFVAFSVWIVTGFLAGIAAALTTIVAGALLVDVTRQWAFDALERRLRRLAGDVGSALWPGTPAQIVSYD